jgi:hypothetical protein
VFENDGMKPLLKQSEHFSRPMNLGNYHRLAGLDVNYIILESTVCSQKFFSGVVANSPSLHNLSDPALRSSMSMDDLLNHIDCCITEQKSIVDP